MSHRVGSRPRGRPVNGGPSNYPGIVHTIPKRRQQSAMDRCPPGHRDRRHRRVQSGRYLPVPFPGSVDGRRRRLCRCSRVTKLNPAEGAGVIQRLEHEVGHGRRRCQRDAHWHSGFERWRRRIASRSISSTCAGGECRSTLSSQDTSRRSFDRSPRVRSARYGKHSRASTLNLKNLFDGPGEYRRTAIRQSSGLLVLKPSTGLVAKRAARERPVCPICRA